MTREQLIHLKELGFKIGFISKITGIKKGKLNNLFYLQSAKFSKEESYISNRFYSDAVRFMEGWK